MIDMRVFILLLAFALTAIASPSPWHRQHHKHHHRNKPASPTPTLTPSPSSSAGSLTNSVEATDTVFPTLSVTAGSGTDVPGASGSAASGTSSRSKCSSLKGTAPGTAPGTAVGTASRGSFTIRPTGYTNGTTLQASSGLAPKSTYTPSVGTSKPSATTNTSQPAASGTPCTDFLRGINIGGWLLLDSTLNVNLLGAVDALDQWAFDSASGASTKLTGHWDSYFKESDVKLLKSYGINSLKIPIGYWSYDNSGTPYQQGADAYLEKAIGWAEAAGMKVWVDISNTQTIPEISSDRALSHSLAILKTVAKKYGSTKYANVVTAIEIFSCPIATPNQDTTAHETFTKQAFAAIKAAATNPNLQVIIPDASASPSAWEPLSSSLSPTKGFLSVAESMSELSCPCEQAMTQAQHIEAACQRGYAMAGVNALGISVYAGEFNPATNATMDVEGWTEAVVTDVRKYVEAQLQVFEVYTSGYFFWSWADESEEIEGKGWGFKAGVAKGYIPVPLDDPEQRKFPHQCDG